MPSFIQLPILAAVLLTVGTAGESFAASRRRAPRTADTVRVSADYRVWMPSASDPVQYTLRMASVPQRADTLMGMSYLIDYTLHGPEGDSRGFSAYLPGSLYDYRPGRLREYHADRDPQLFAPGGDKSRGVELRTQFVQLLPDLLTARFARMQRDRSYRVTSTRVPEGRKTVATHYYQGQPSERFTLIVNPQGQPVSYTADTNLDQVSEQSVSVTYDYSGPSLSVPADENALSALYPEAFETGRTDDWRLQQLKGSPLPSFAIRRLDGERMIYRRGEVLEAPTIIAVLNPSVGLAHATIAALRNAVDSYPGNLQLWLAIIDNRDDAVRELLGTIRPDETVLVGAKALARDCGITDTPLMLLVGRDGKVQQIIHGLNNHLADEVIMWSAGQ